MRGARGGAFGGPAKEGRDDRAKEHETEHVKAVVEGHQVRVPPDRGVEGSDRLLTRGVGIASR